jgi:conjugative relaxase-like TrwC/TraI family protein
VLRLAKLTDAEYVLDQVAGGLEDYYLGSGEAPGVWAGRLADQLELAGIVIAEDLRALIEGRHPATGETLIGAKQPTVRAIDATLSAPKSASLLWAFGTPEAASVVSIAHVEAVAAALDFVESRAAVTRRQHVGQRTRASTSGWAVATFVHRTSREGDPQLHTHCIIPNLVQRADGAWVALDATALYRWAKAAGSVYQEELRRRLTERLGVGWGADRNGCREMTGISETQLRAFSKRTLQIEAHLAATGGLPEDRKARMHADEAASVATRARKDRTLTPSRLRDRWDTEAAVARLPTGQALVDALQRRRVCGPIAALEVEVLFDRLVDPEVGLCANDSRFGEAQVVEAVAAWGAGRLTVVDITDLTRRFLESRRVVRLINTDPSGRAPGQWSTLTHRAVEDRVLDHLALLEKRAARPLNASAVAAAIANAPTLGDDQIAAVHTLAASGPALRALIAPAGHGKTTTLATAVDAARRSGRAVLALSTTNQAVDQLRQVGIPAVTVARFTLDGAQLEPGSVVIVDECSQLPTHEADVVLAAVAACAGGQVWMVGDPLQAQPVRAGGLAPWLAAEIDARRVVAAQLTENRRQAHPIEREALTAFRDGQVETSQELREGQGWEHHHRSRETAVAAMAAAVLTDMDAYGAEHIAALAVTHADCEALADRIRADLTEQDRIGGPTLEGPGWSGPRRYQAGDRILLHANATLRDGRRLTNGTVATVLGVSAAGLTILPDDDRHAACLREDFVTRTAPDGRPQVSHAWARTIDGVQGGTWDQVHLLATPALDRYRGYVGQSRSVCPTHTWNTIPTPTDDDHGGRIVRPHSTDADQIAAALARANPKTFAADLDPYRIEKAIHDEQALHRAHLDRRPPDVTERLAASRAEMIECEDSVEKVKERLIFWQERHDGTAGLRRLSPTFRRMHAEAIVNIGATGAAVERAEAALAAANRRYERVRRQQADGVTFDRANQWRIQSIEHLQQQLDDHWTAATVSATRDGNPYAYGPQHLRTARQTLAAQIDDPRQLVVDSPLATTVGDPVQALIDLDRPVIDAARAPSLQPVARHQVQPAQGPGIQIMHEHAAHLGYTQAAPTPSIQI